MTMVRAFRLLVFAVLLCLVGFPAGAKVEEAEAMAWAQRLESAVLAGQADGSLIDDRRLVTEAIAGFRLDPDQAQMFYAFRLSERLIPGIQRGLGDDGSYRFLRFREVDGQPRALFRFVSLEGINYHEWYLDRDAQRRVVAWDVEVYLTGERMSRTLRRMWVPAVAEIDPDFARHMGDRNRMLIEYMDELGALNTAFQRRDAEDVIARYAALPEAMQDEMLPMLAAMTSYAALGRMEPYAELAERYAQLHGGASNAELSMIDVMLLNEDYDGAWALVDALDERVGGDPFLYLFRANVADARGDYAEAQRLLDVGLAEDPTLIDLIWLAMDLALWEEDWPRVSAMLTAVEAQGVELLDLREVEGFEGYIASEDYQRWLAGRAGAADGE